MDVADIGSANCDHGHHPPSGAAAKNGLASLLINFSLRIQWLFQNLKLRKSVICTRRAGRPLPQGTTAQGSNANKKIKRDVFIQASCECSTKIRLPRTIRLLRRRIGLNLVKLNCLSLQHCHLHLPLLDDVDERMSRTNLPSQFLILPLTSKNWILLLKLLI